MKLSLSVTAALLLVAFSTRASDGLVQENEQCVRLTASDHRSVSLEFELPEIQKQEVEREGELFEAYDVPGEGVTYEYGRPLLPAISRFVVVPPTAGLELVVRPDHPRTVRSIHPPVLCLDESLTDTGGADIPVRYDDGLYPPVVAEMSEPSVIRGVRLVKLTTYPIQYDPASGSYIHHEHIEAEIRFTDDPPESPARVPVRRNRSREFLKFIRALALGGDEVGRDDPDRDVEPE